MKKIGVISDTHLTTPSGVVSTVKRKIRNTRSLEDLRTLVGQYFQDVERIIHAGDFVEAEVFEMLRELAPVEAVQGNMDTAKIRGQFPAKKVLNIEGFTIAVTHGSGAPQGIIDRIKPLFTDVDVIVFGHTHQPFNEKRDGILFFNPGSPTDRIFAPYNSLGILDIADEITGRIIRI